MQARLELELRRAEHHLADEAVGVAALHAVLDRRVAVSLEEEVDERRAAACDRAADAHERGRQLLHEADGGEEADGRRVFLRRERVRLLEEQHALRHHRRRVRHDELHARACGQDGLIPREVPAGRDGEQRLARELFTELGDDRLDLIRLARHDERIAGSRELSKRPQRRKADGGRIFFELVLMRRIGEHVLLRDAA